MWKNVLAVCVLAGFARSLPAQSTAEPTVTIDATDGRASETGPDTGTFTVRRTGPTNFPLLVFYQLSGTASNGVDYEPLGNTVQIPAGAFDAAFIVKPIDDSLAEGNETVVAQITGSPLACATCGYTIGVPSNAVVIIEDNDTQTNHPPDVRLITPRNGDVFIAPATIALRADANDAEDGDHLTVEFFEGTNRLGFGTFVDGLCPICPFYALTWSNVPAGNYTVTARATDRAGAGSVSDAVYITVFGGVNIYATDPQASEIASDPNIDPPTDPAIFTVRRFGETNLGIVVYYEVGGTASNGVDYLTLPGQITIPAGASSAHIVVRPIDDNLVEGTETVVLTLLPTCPQCLFSNPMCDVPEGTNCYPIGPDNTAVAYIHDNDPGTNHSPFVQLTAPREGDAFVAPADIHLVAFAQDAEDGYSLTVEFFEGANSLGLGTFNPTRCWPGCPNYTLTWSSVPAGNYTLTARATDSGGASMVSDSVHILVFEESNRPPVVSLVARDPFASEGTNLWRLGWDANDRSALDIWNAWHVNVGGSNTATFVVRRHGPTNSALVVNYEIGGTASNGVDYVALPGSVTIPAGRHSAPIVVVPIDDALAEGIETVVLTLQPSPDYTVGFASHAAAIIIDDDQPRPPCVRLRDGLFHLCGRATNGFCFRVEASTDLLHWRPLCTNIVTDGALHFIDPDSPPFNARFYRAAPAPTLPPDD